MGTRPDGSSVIPIVVVELDVSHHHVLALCSNYTMRAGVVDNVVLVGTSADEQGAIDLTHLITVHHLAHLNTSPYIICCFEIEPADISESFRNSSISPVHPSGVVFHPCRNWWILVVRIIWSVGVVSYRFAWELPWDHMMEDSKTISSTGVSVVSSELTNSFVFWANVSAG